MVLASAVMSASLGVASAAPARSSTPPVPGPISAAGARPSWTMQAPVAAGSAGPLLAEAQQVFQSMQQTKYDHQYTITPASGTYFWDCIGFTNWAMRQATPNAWQAFHTAMNVPTQNSGLVYLWAKFITSGSMGASWQSVPTVTSLSGGELMIVPGETVSNGAVVYGASPGQTSYEGHALIVAGPALKLRDGSYALFVYDSTALPGHGAYDSRLTDGRALPLAGTTANYSGTGFGTIRLTVNSSGVPTAVYWSGNAKQPITFQNQPVVPVFARPLN